MSAMIGDRARSVSDRLRLRDDCLVVERMEGVAGGKKKPAQGMGRGC